MIPYGLFSQLLLLVLTGLLAFTYIKPTVTDITQTQEKIATYDQEISKVSNVNSTLAKLVTEYNNVSSSDRMKLLTYMPDAVDTVAVPRDIAAIAARAGVLLSDVSYSGAVQQSAAAFDEVTIVVDTEPEAHKFSVAFEGSYDQLKFFLKMLEENVYPLEVRELVIEKGEGGFLSVTMEIVTYDREKEVVPLPALQ